MKLRVVIFHDNQLLGDFPKCNADAVTAVNAAPDGAYVYLPPVWMVKAKEPDPKVPLEDVPQVYRTWLLIL
jgi:hypothetical protein